MPRGAPASPSLTDGWATTGLHLLTGQPGSVPQGQMELDSLLNPDSVAVLVTSA